MWPATIIGSHLAREPTPRPVLTKCWNREVTLATNFGSHAQMVTKFGGQNLATKFGFVPDCWKCHQINHFWSNFAWNWSNSAWILSFASEKWWNQVKMAKISQKYILGYRASAKIRPLATEISPKRDPWLRKLWNWAPKGNLAGSTPPVRSTHNKCLSHKYMYMYLTWFNLNPSMVKQAEKLKIFGTRLNWVVSYIAITKFHSPRPVFPSPGQIFTRIGERYFPSLVKSSHAQ